MQSLVGALTEMIDLIDYELPDESVLGVPRHKAFISARNDLESLLEKVIEVKEIIYV